MGIPNKRTFAILEERKNYLIGKNQEYNNENSYINAEISALDTIINFSKSVLNNFPDETDDIMLIKKMLRKMLYEYKLNNTSAEEAENIHTKEKEKKAGIRVTTPLKVKIQDVTVEGLLKACYMGSVLGYKFYESVREQCLFNALKEDVADNFLAAAPEKGLMRLMFKSKLRQERAKADAHLRESIAAIRDEYSAIASQNGKPANAASIFGTKARLNIVLEVLSKITPNHFPKTTDLLQHGAAFDKVVVYDRDKYHRPRIHDSDGGFVSIDEKCFFLAQSRLFAFLQVANIFDAMNINDIAGWKFIPRGRNDPR
jgi:hypothetical protein